MPRFAARDFSSAIVPSTGTATFTGDGTLAEKTYAFWWKGSFASAGGGTSIIKHGANTGELYVGFGTAAAPSFVWELSGTIYQYFSVPVSVHDGNYHHIVFYNDGTTAASVTNCRLWVDGVEMSKGINSQVGSPTAWGSLIVNGYAGSQTTDLVVTNGLPTQAEITALYYNNQLPKSVTVTHFIPFNDGSGTVATDYSGNGNNGTLAGAATWTTNTVRRQTQNYLQYSEDLTSSVFTKVRSSISANTSTAPDGTMTADKIVEDNTAGNSHYTYQTPSQNIPPNALRTFSVYAKAAERTFVAIYMDGGNRGSYFNLGTGAFGTSFLGTGDTRAIEDVGGGWYRISVTTIAPTGNKDCVVTLASADNVLIYNGDGTSGLYIWGEQLEPGRIATPYRPMDAFARYNGSRNIVSQKQNLLSVSNTFSSGSWNKTNASVATTTASADPFGGSNAWLMTEDNTTNNHRMYITDAQTTIVGQKITTSIYAKAGVRSWVYLTTNDVVGTRGWFNVSTGAKGTVDTGVTSDMISVGNGWYRCSITFTNSIANSGLNHSFGLTSADAVVSGVGDGTGTMYFYNAQAVNANQQGPTVVTNSSAFNEGNIRNIVPQGQNLLLWSENFDTATSGATWNKVASSIGTNATTPPLNSSTAQKLIEDNTNALHRIQQTFPSGVSGKTIVYSREVKAAERSWVVFNVAGLANSEAWFNASTGTFGTVQSKIIDKGVISLGNGWYRPWIEIALTGGSTFDFFISTGDGVGTYQGDGTSGVYIAGSQVVLSANWPGAYVRTTTASVNNGNIRNIVPQGQNLLLWSESLDTATSGATWTKQASVTVTGNQAANPYDGTTTADLIDVSAAANQTGIYQSFSTTKGKTYTFSVWLKTVSGTGNVELADGGGSGSSVKAITNSWARYSFTFTGIANTVLAQIRKATSGQATTFYAWGAQLVQANWAGPYVPTMTAAVNTGNIRNIAQ